MGRFRINQNTTVWISPSARMQFEYRGGRTAEVSTPWLDALTFVANGPRGLHIVPEPDRAALDRWQGEGGHGRDGVQHSQAEVVAASRWLTPG